MAADLSLIRFKDE